MSLIDEIQHEQMLTAERIVFRNLERQGLSEPVPSVVGKPAFALVAVEPGTLIVQRLAGWTLDSLDDASAEGLITLRTTWAKVVGGLLFSTLTKDQFMALSA